MTDGHDGGDDAVDALAALLLAGFDVAGDIGFDSDNDECNRFSYIALSSQ